MLVVKIRVNLKTFEHFLVVETIAIFLSQWDSRKGNILKHYYGRISRQLSHLVA